MSRRPGRRTTRFEAILLVAMGGVVAVGAAPSVQQSVQEANEASAIASLKITTAAQVAYAAACGRGGFAATYVILGTPVVPGTAAFISPELGSAVQPEFDGYTFSLGAGIDNDVGPEDCLPDPNPTNTTYYAAAVPTYFGETGSRSFAVNAGNTIWEEPAAVAPMEPFGPPSRPIRR